MSIYGEGMSICEEEMQLKIDQEEFQYVYEKIQDIYGMSDMWLINDNNQLTPLTELSIQELYDIKDNHNKYVTICFEKVNQPRIIGMKKTH